MTSHNFQTWIFWVPRNSTIYSLILITNWSLKSGVVATAGITGFIRSWNIMKSHGIWKCIFKAWKSCGIAGKMAFSLSLSKNMPPKRPISVWTLYISVLIMISRSRELQIYVHLLSLKFWFRVIYASWSVNIQFWFTLATDRPARWFSRIRSSLPLSCSCVVLTIVAWRWILCAWPHCDCAVQARILFVSVINAFQPPFFNYSNLF